MVTERGYTAVSDRIALATNPSNWDIYFVTAHNEMIHIEQKAQGFRSLTIELDDGTIIQEGDPNDSNRPIHQRD